MSNFSICAIACAFAVAALMIAEQRESRLGVWIFKPLASTLFVAAGLAHGGLDSTYGHWIVAALVLSWIGDLLLIPHSQPLFMAGIGSFLVGHLLFGAAFVARGFALAWTLAALPVLALVAAIVGRWLLPKVPGALRGAVVAYILVISAMVALAVGNYGFEARPLLPFAALCFYFSDLSVARDRFVAPGFVNRLWGLPLYYGAQILFAATI